MYFGQEDLEKIKKPNPALLKGEVGPHHRMDQLNLDLNTVFRRLLNYMVNFVGQKTKSHKDWISIGEAIETKPLTETGKLKLEFRHKLFEEKVLPQPRNLAIALIPILLYLGVKTYVGGKLHERKIEGVLKGKRDKRRAEQQLAKKRKRASKQAKP